jgi:prophage antirepressor-like protein
MTDIIGLHFEGKPVRVITRDGDPWFVAADVCRVLEIEHASSATRILDEDEKGVHTMHTPGGSQDMAIISEPGLYKLMARSRKPEAKRFDRWVRHEVLPSIRKTGGYMVVAPVDPAAFLSEPAALAAAFTAGGMEAIFTARSARCGRCRDLGRRRAHLLSFLCRPPA